MSSLAQIGWWEADFAAGHYLCSDFLCELLGLEGDTISFQDFQKLIREDYREQIIQEFRANANIHRNFYEQTFPVRSRYGEIWLHTRLAHREKGTGTNGGDKSFGVIQRVEAPKESEQRDALRRVNSLLRRQSFISQSLLRFLHDEEVDSCVMEILNDILNLYYGEGRVYIFEYDEKAVRQVYYEDGLQAGRKDGIKTGILNMLKTQKYSLEEISEVFQVPVEEIEQIKKQQI